MERMTLQSNCDVLSTGKALSKLDYHEILRYIAISDGTQHCPSLLTVSLANSLFFVALSSSFQSLGVGHPMKVPATGRRPTTACEPSSSIMPAISQIGDSNNTTMSCNEAHLVRKVSICTSRSLLGFRLSSDLTPAFLPPSSAIGLHQATAPTSSIRCFISAKKLSSSGQNPQNSVSVCVMLMLTTEQTGPSCHVIVRTVLAGTRPTHARAPPGAPSPVKLRQTYS